jgi:hypothetical protein
MTCDHALELLPWLLNDTLEEGERHEVLAHVRGCEACRRALGDTRFAMAAAGAHLPSAALVAVAFGEEASGLDPALVEEHLAACPQCAADLELARTSRALADESIALLPRRTAAPTPRRAAGWQAAAVAAGLSAVVFAAGWLHTRQQVERLEARATAPAGGPVQATPAGGGAPAPAGSSRSAGLEEENRLRREVAVQRDAARSARQEADDLRRQLARAAGAPAGATGPQVNTIIADLRPPGSDVVRGTAPGAARIELPPGAGGLTLILQPYSDERSTFSQHVAELRDAAGKLVLNAPGLVQQEDLAFTLTLEASDLPTGAYTLELYGISGQGREKLVTHSFRIE